MAVEKWNQVIGAFATSTGLTPEQVAERLKPLVGEPSDEAAELLGSEQDAPDADIKRCFDGADIPTARLNRAIRAVRMVPPIPDATQTAAVQVNANLPVLPDDEAFLDILVTGGVPKMPDTDAVAAVRASFADSMRLFDVVGLLADRVEVHAEEIGEPNPGVFVALEQERARRKYADVLKAMGQPGNLVTEERKRKLLTRMVTAWPALASFQERLDGWVQSWLETSASPAALMSILAGARGAPSPAVQLMQAPDAGPVLDAARSVIDVFNQAFAGAGIPVARALAHEALSIKRILETPELPAALGASSRDEMFKKLGIAVTADTARNERSVAQYVLAIMRLNAVPVTEQPGYIVSLAQLGRTIAWDTLVLRRATTSNVQRVMGGAGREGRSNARD